MNVAFACFFKTLKFKDFIAFKKQFRIIKENKHASWTLVGKCILFTLSILLTLLVLLATVIGIILVPFVLFLGEFISYNLCAQYAKEIEIDKYLEN